MKKALKLIIKIFISMIQFALITSAVMLQYYSKKKMGVMRYLVYKNRVFESSLFNGAMNSVYKLILILGIIIGVVLLYKAMKKESKFIFSSLLCLILNIAGLVLIFNNISSAYLGYYFFLIALFGVIFIQYLKVMLIRKHV